MEEWLSRTALLIGEEGIQRLSQAKVAVVGLGGVGGAALEALCRAGVGSLMLVDPDVLEATNLNRQLLATVDTLGQKKAQAAAHRARQIHPAVRLAVEERAYRAEDSQFLYDYSPDYVIDAMDMVSSKLHLAEGCHQRDLPLICCLGTGNRLDPGKLRIGRIEDTAEGCGCPLARVMRRELKKRGIVGQQVLYSQELPCRAICPGGEETGRHSPGSISFVPPVAGYLLAAQAVHALLER